MTQPDETTPLLSEAVGCRAVESQALRRSLDEEHGSGVDHPPQPVGQPGLPSDAKYERFSSRRKRGIVAVVSWCGLMPLFVSGSFFPAIPQISQDFNSSPEIVSLAISLSLFAAGLGGLSGASYSGIYGRRPVYLCGQALFCFGSLNVALSRSVPQLMFWRFFQAFGASPGLSVGAGVIGDIYKLEERGTAMGIFLAATLIGPTLAPPAGGLAVYYASWRAMQYALCAAGLIGFLSMYLFFPETHHAHVDWSAVDGIPADEQKKPMKSKGIVLINPLEPFAILKQPHILGIAITCFTVAFTDYVLLVPLAYTLGVRYNITSEAVLGACFLPIGLGNAIGAPIAGRLSDKSIIYWRNRRGAWYPEDRLRVGLFSAATFVPLSALFFGLSVQYVDGSVGLVLCLLCLFMNGLGLQTVIGTCSSYLVDIMHSQSAQSIAANSAFRATLISFCLAGILPTIDLVGVAATGALSAALAWVGFISLWCVVKYGDKLRAYSSR